MPRSRWRGLKVGSNAIQIPHAKNNPCTKCTVALVRKTPRRLSSLNCRVCDFQRIESTITGSNEANANNLNAGLRNRLKASFCDFRFAFSAIQKPVSACPDTLCHRGINKYRLTPANPQPLTRSSHRLSYKI